MKQDSDETDFVCPKRQEQLRQRKCIVHDLQNMPVPVGSKAYDIIWNAIDLINGYEYEVSVIRNRLKVLQDEVQTQQDRLDGYFGGA
jgi:hypothetical protein